MEFINFNDLNDFNTKFTAKEFLNYIHTYLRNNLPPNINYTITELSYDPLYDVVLPHCTATVMWSIELFVIDDADMHLIINRDSFYLTPKYQILVSFLEIAFSDDDINLVEFTNNSNVRSNLCNELIFSIKYFITFSSYYF